MNQMATMEKGCCMSARILTEVLNERHRQDALWKGQDHSPFKWGMILGDTYGSVCRAVIQTPGVDLRDELVKLAAITVAAIESIDKAGGDSL